MYLNYPTDETIFACVLSDHKSNKPKDSGILSEVRKRIPWFEGSMELEQTLKAVLELEQLGGRKITWVASEFTYEELCRGETGIIGKKSPMLPNVLSRFCTQELKLYPIFNHCYLNYDEHHIIMNIGFRADEEKRVKKYDKGCKLNKITFSHKCDIEGRFKGKHRYTKEYYWRDMSFPLYYDGVTKQDVNSFIEKTGILFPEISNCAYCFFHKTAEHLKQFEQNPEQAESWIELEELVGATFDKKLSLQEILDGSANKPGESGCMCTD